MPPLGRLFRWAALWYFYMCSLSRVEKMSAGFDGRGNSPSHAWQRALEMTAPIANNTAVTFPTIIETLGEKFGMAIALISDEQCLTYRALAESANRYARWALTQRIAAGDVVCLLMP